MQLVRLIHAFLQEHPTATQQEIEDHLIALLEQGKLNRFDEQYVRAESQQRR